MEQWEYKTLKLQTGGFLGGVLNEEDFQNELNNYGKNGWELVSCFATASSGTSFEVIAVFKRRR